MSGGIDDIASRITKLTLAPGLPREVWSELCRIDSDLRAQRAASRERVREVVEKIGTEELGCLVTRVEWRGVPQTAAQRIADRVADALAASQPRRVPTLEETLDRHAGVMAGLAEVERNGRPTPQPRDDRRPLPPEVMTGAMQNAVHDDAGPGRPARSVRVAGKLDAARVRDVVREAARANWPFGVKSGGVDTVCDAIAARAAEQLAGYAVALSSEERKALRELREELRESMDADHPGLAAFDHLLAKPGQGASPAPHRYNQDTTSGIGHCKVCGSDDASDGNHVAEPQPGPTASAVDPALCRRLASDATEDDGRITPGSWIRTRNNLPEVARQLTAAADLAEAFEEATGKLAMAVTAKENAERDLEAARRELADLMAERGSAADLVAKLNSVRDEAKDLRDQRDAARGECKRLQSELNKRPLRTFDQLAADRLADEVAVLVRRKVIDARSPAGDALLDYRDPPPSPRADRLATLEAEFVALRRTLWARLEERQAMTSRIYDLLATEPAVSEERCGEIDRRRAELAGNPGADGARFTLTIDDIPALIAALRQLHALRAGLREIVGVAGSVTHRCARCNVVLCSSDDSVDAAIEAHRSVCSGPGHSDAVPLAWTVTPERVEALRWAAKLLGVTWSAASQEAHSDAACELAAMLAEVPEIVGGEATPAPARATLDPQQLLDLQRMREDYRVALEEVAKQAERFPRIVKFAEARDERRRHLWLLDHLLSIFGGTQT